MKKNLIAAGFALLLMGALGASEARAGAKDLLGKWQVLSIDKQGTVRPMPAALQIVVGFHAAGKLSLTISYRGKTQTKSGTYKVQGKKLSMTLDNTTEKVTYARKGKTLTLTNTVKGETTRLQRQ